MWEPARPRGRHFGRADAEHIPAWRHDLAQLDSTGEQTSANAPMAGEQAPSAGTSVAKSSLIMALGTLTSRILGLVRSPIMLGAVVGMTTPVANSFDVANKLPTLIYMVIAGGLVNAVLVPALVRAMRRFEDNGAAFINKLMTITIVVLGSVTVLLTLASPLLVKVFAATMAPEWFRVTVLFAFWCIPQIFFYGLYVVIGQILNARENFGPYMWSPALNNVVAISGLVLMLVFFGSPSNAVLHDASAWNGWRVAILGGFSTAGIAAQALVLLIPLRKLGIRFHPDFHWRGVGLSEVGGASMWVLATMVGGMIPTILISNIAAGATMRAQRMGVDLQTVGGNYTYSTAELIYNLPTSLITVSIVTAVFTRISQYAVDNDIASMRRSIARTTSVITTLMFLCTTGLVTLASPVARILAFTVSPREALTLAFAIMTMVLGLVGSGLIRVYTRVFYALNKMKEQFLVNVPAQVFLALAYIALNFAPPSWVVPAIGSAMFVGNIICVVYQIILLNRWYSLVDVRQLWLMIGRLLAVSLVAGACGAFVLRLFGPLWVPLGVGGALARLLAAGIVIVVVFVALLKFLRIPEYQELKPYVNAVGHVATLIRSKATRRHGSRAAS